MKGIKAYGDTEGPLGFPMQSDVAKAVDKMLKEIPKDVSQRFSTEVGDQYVEGYCRYYCSKAVTQLSIKDRTEVSLVSSAVLDRDFEVVQSAGLSWDQFKKNPVVTFDHMYNQLPVGRSMWVKRQKSKDPALDGWVAKTRYFSKPDGWQNWLPDAILNMLGEDGMKGKSIGFVPIEVREPQEADIKKRPELAAARYIIAKALILEYAVAPVPANPTALTLAIDHVRSKGFELPDNFLQEMGFIMPEDVPLEEMIEKNSKSKLPSIKGAKTLSDLKREIRKGLIQDLNSSLSQEILASIRGDV